MCYNVDNICMLCHIVLCILQVAGLTSVIIGVSAWLDNEHNDLMSQLPTLPALLLIVVGALGSFIGLVGFLGAIRESCCLLKTVKAAFSY